MSPISGLTDRSPNFPQIGILRKGEKKPERGIGRDLDHFRFESEDAEVAAAFLRAYGPAPKQINVFLPHPSVDENWSAWKEHWLAGGLQHRCDAVYCVDWIGQDGRMHHASDGEVQPQCPGNCKQVGRLRVLVVDGTQLLANRLAFVTSLTSSINDIARLQEQLEALYSIRGSLQGIPLVLRRYPVTITKTRVDQKTGEIIRSRGKSALLSIEARSSWVDLQMQAIEEAARPVVHQLAAGSPTPVPSPDRAMPMEAPAPNFAAAPDDDDDDDIQDGDFEEPPPADVSPPTDAVPPTAAVPPATRAGSTSDSLRQTSERVTKADTDEPASPKALAWYEQHITEAAGYSEIDLERFSINTGAATRGQMDEINKALAVALASARRERAS